MTAHNQCRSGTTPGSTLVVRLISFGYLHDDPPEADVTVDVRTKFKDPHFDSGLRHLDATDGRVRRVVLATPGIAALADAIADIVQAFLAGPGSSPVTIAIGCAGGRHRSAVLADTTATILGTHGIPARVTHRDIGRPVVRRTDRNSTEGNS